jgi:hypothetical protein
VTKLHLFSFEKQILKIKLSVLLLQHLNNYLKMKKLFTLVAVALASLMVACGPSKEELEAKEKRRQDSIAAVEQARMEEEARLAAEAAAEQARLDSIRMAEEAAAAAAATKGGKPRPAAPKPAEPKVETKSDQGGARGGAAKEGSGSADGKTQNVRGGATKQN